MLMWDAKAPRRGGLCQLPTLKEKSCWTTYNRTGSLIDQLNKICAICSCYICKVIGHLMEAGNLCCLRCEAPARLPGWIHSRNRLEFTECLSLVLMPSSLSLCLLFLSGWYMADRLFPLGGESSLRVWQFSDHYQKMTEIYSTLGEKEWGVWFLGGFRLNILFWAHINWEFCAHWEGE